jgi:hypothetical protein
MTTSPSAETNQPDPKQLKEQRKVIIIIIVIAILVLAGLITGTVALVNAGNTTTSLVRDIFIIFMALEALIIGAALVILSIQLAILINLLQNEIKPILQSTNETVNTVKGTVTFLGNNMAEPIITLNEYLAAFKRLVDILRLGRR